MAAAALGSPSSKPVGHDAASMGNIVGVDQRGPPRPRPMSKPQPRKGHVRQEHLGMRRRGQPSPDAAR